MQVGTGKNVSFNKYDNMSQWVDVPSGIYIVNDINKEGGPQIIVNTTYLEGGNILSGGVNRFRANSIETHDVAEYNQGYSFGISNNLNDIISTLPSGQALPVWTFSIGKDNSSGRYLGTIYGAAGTEKVDIKIPIINEATLENFKKNRDWLQSKMEPREVPQQSHFIHHDKTPKHKSSPDERNEIREKDKQFIDDIQKDIDSADDVIHSKINVDTSQKAIKEEGLGEMNARRQEEKEAREFIESVEAYTQASLPDPTLPMPDSGYGQFVTPAKDGQFVIPAQAGIQDKETNPLPDPHFDTSQGAIAKARAEMESNMPESQQGNPNPTLTDHPDSFWMQELMNGLRNNIQTEVKLWYG